MRVLVVDCNLRYMNPMRALLPFYISSTEDDVVFFGPGYSSSEDIFGGLDRFVQREGPFDIEIRTVQSLPPAVTETITSNFSKDKLSFYKRSFSYHFSNEDLSAFWKDEGINRKFSGKRVILLHQYDFQAMSEVFRDYVLEGYDLIVGLSQEFWAHHNYDDMVLSNGYMHTSCWQEILDGARDKVLGLPNFVAPHEFDFNLHQNRLLDWSVVGTTYKDRGVVKQQLSNNSVKYTSGRTWRYYFIQIKNKLGINPFNSRRNLDILNQEFQYSLSQSKYGFTCGSDLKMPIRKFFEIPAAGCTLVASPCNGFQSLGFIDGVNALVCEPRRVGELGRYLANNPMHGQEIAKAGQKLVLTKHTIGKRSEQLWEAMRRIRAGCYSGSYWNQGDLLFH